MKISFFGGLSKTRYVDVSNQMCSNLFLETAAGGQVGAIYGTPGLDVLLAVRPGAPIRGMIPVGDYVYGVAGEQIFRVDTSGTDYKLIGVVPFATTPVSMVDNGVQVVIADGTINLTVVTLSTFAVTTVPMLFLCEKIAYLDSYIVAIAKGTQQFYISDNLDATSWDSLDFSSCDGSTDAILSVVTAHRQLWFLKKYAAEVWYNSGDTFPISRVTGVYLEAGTAAVHSPAVVDNTVYWLTDKLTVVRSNEYVPEIVSTREVESMIEDLGTVSDAIGTKFTIQGHAFYQLKFPSGGLTLAYDISNNSWLKRTSGDTERNWTGNSVVTIGKKVLVGDEFGNLCHLTMDCYTDSGYGSNIREASTLHVTNEGKQLSYQRFGLDLARPTASDPTIMLSLSDNGGRTWEECGDRTAPPYEWVALGSAWKRQYRIRISEAYPLAISEAYFDAEPWGR